MILKEQKIHVQASILRCFWVWEPPLERPGDHPGMGTLKIIKRSLFWTFFLEHIYDRCCIFVVACFAMFSEPHFCQLSGLRGSHAHQFEAHVGTNLMTFPIHVEKWRLRFRSRWDIKIKFFRVCVSRWFINCWYVLSKPVIATLHRRHYWHYAQFMDSLGLHFGVKIAILST